MNILELRQQLLKAIKQITNQNLQEARDSLGKIICWIDIENGFSDGDNPRFKEVIEVNKKSKLIHDTVKYLPRTIGKEPKQGNSIRPFFDPPTKFFVLLLWSMICIHLGTWIEKSFGK